MEDRSNYLKSSCLDAALEYAEMGLSVIPVRPDKKPYISWGEFQERQASPEEIREFWSKFPDAGVGIITGTVSGLFVIDADNEEAYQQIQQSLPDALATPTAKSPKGYHTYFEMPADTIIGNATGIFPGVDIRGEGGYVVAAPSVNGTGKVYRWIDGLSIIEVPPAPCPSTFLKKIIKAVKSISGRDRGLPAAKENMFIEGRRDEDLFHTALCLAKGGCSEQEAMKIIEGIAEKCNPPFPLPEAMAKVKSAFERAKRRERNLMGEIREWCMAATGEFMITDIYRELKLVSRQDMVAASVCLFRLCKEENPIIEKAGRKRGSFRVVDASCDMMNFKREAEKTLNLSFPFDIQNFIELYPGNLIVLAGAPNAGKTAFMLNVIKMNMKKFDIAYFNSEMGETELRKRLEKFEDMRIDDWDFKAYERSADFQDVILTGEGRLNLIDYLEIHDEFYKVGGLLAEIHRKLNGALAIIAIQKNKGVDTGLGGARTLEKPRLALAMEPGKIKIVKAKNWATSVNPNGLEMEWKLVDGCHFKPWGIWKRPEEIERG